MFLDVICLRQEDSEQPQLEVRRLEEWRIDVPTIGFIYPQHTYAFKHKVIIYFNGLGIPFRNEAVDPSDRYHWFNRIWTMQELPEEFYPAGLDFKASLQMRDSNRSQWDLWAGSAFQKQLRRIVQPFNGLRTWDIRGRNNWHAILHEVRRRYCANKMDKISDLPYILQCDRFPVYNTAITDEKAWSLLIECVDDTTRAGLFFEGHIQAAS